MLTTHSKSPVQIMRQRVLGPGYTEHNGRGSYQMDTKRSYDDIVARVNRLDEKTDLIIGVAEFDKNESARIKTGWPYSRCDYRRLIVTFRATRDPKSNEKWFYRRFVVIDQGNDCPASVIGISC